MKKVLQRIPVIYYYENEKRIEGVPPGVTGDLSGVHGDLTGVRGNIDDCKITDEERAAGIDINDLIV
jgi:hypothetical protein